MILLFIIQCSDLCMSSALHTRVSVRGQPVGVLSQVEPRWVHTDLPTGPSVWSSQSVPQSPAGSVYICIYVCVCSFVFLLLKTSPVSVTLPQLDLKSGDTSTLLDPFNRPQTGRLRRKRLAVWLVGMGWSWLRSLCPALSGDFAGIYEALPSCCWSADSQRVVFSSARRNWKVTRVHTYTYLLSNHQFTEMSLH